MPDVTYSVKLAEDVQERIKKLVEDSGISSKEFFTNLITNFQLEQVKESAPILSDSITELQSLTKRIDSIFIGLGGRVNTLQLDYKDTLNTETRRLQDLLTLQDEQISKLKQDKLHNEERINCFIADEALAKSKLEELTQKIKLLEGAVLDKTTLVEEYKQKDASLTSIVSEYKTCVNENTRLKSELINLQQTYNSQMQEISILQNKSEKEHIELQSQLIYKENILKLEYENKTLELKQELQSKLEEQQEKYRVQINDYESKVKKLLDVQTNN